MTRTSDHHTTAHHGPTEDSIAWLRVTPFIALHLACLAPLWVGVSGIAVAVAIAAYALRAFAVSAFYHRCFSHRAFHVNRVVQFVFAFLGAAATQRGPLWWAAQHRLHHTHADSEDDPHSSRRGFWWSHVAWFLSRAHFHTPLERVPDLAQFKELAWLDRFDLFAPVIFAIAMFALGEALEPAFPQTNGWQMLVWGYVISTVALMHATFMVNSLAHRFGKRRFATADHSRNNAWLALITFGEGWHNNHHRYASSARLGFYWWQVDFAWLGLKVLAWFGLVQNLKTPPEAILREGSGGGSQAPRTV
ncbi:MAG: fatty acid desaturase [Gammaproteobacteria bacterium]|nr:fatty acid desaturase [Gammaproteobacteria bacterium]